MDIVERLRNTPNWKTATCACDIAPFEAADEITRLRFALLGLLKIHTDSAGFVGKYGKDLDKAIAEQQTKIDARVAEAKAVLGEWGY